MLYGLPAIILTPFSKKILKMETDIKEQYQIQFIAYTVVKILWDILAVDFITGIEVLSYIDTSVIVVSLFLTLILKEKTMINPNIISTEE